MTGASMSGSCCTSTCLATMLSLGTSRPQTSYPSPSEYSAGQPLHQHLATASDLASCPACAPLSPALVGRARLQVQGQASRVHGVLTAAQRGQSTQPTTDSSARSTAHLSQPASTCSQGATGTKGGIAGPADKVTHCASQPSLQARDCAAPWAALSSKVLCYVCCAE